MSLAAAPTTDAEAPPQEALGRAPERAEEEPAAGPRPSELVALVTQLAPLLGLDPARVNIRAGPPSARPGAVTLPRAERGVVAHELAHVAQHANRGRPDVTRAEAEAAGLAHAARHGATLWLPRGTLPSGHTARLRDASGIAALEKQLDALVAANHQAELRRIADELGAVFATTASMIEASLHVLDTLPFVSARSLVRALARDARMTLAQLGDDHHKLHPRSAVAVLSALTAAEIAALRTDRYDGIRAAAHGLTAANLAPDELRAAQGVLARAPEGEVIELMRGDRRDDFRALVGAVPPSGTEEGALTAAIESERRITAANDAELFDRVNAALDASPHRGLERLEPLTTIVSTELGAAKPATNAPPTAGERLRAVVAKLDAQERIEKRLLDELPEEDRYREPWGTTLRFVLAARNPALNLAKVESLLSYGLFDWAIRDSEDRYAYLLVRSTPIEIQDAWRRRDDGLWYRRLTENLPADMVARGEYTGVGSEFATGLDPKDEASPVAVLEELNAVLGIWRPQRVAPNARIVARRLLGRAPDGRPLGGADTRPLRLMVVRRMDATPEAELNRVVATLPDEYVLGEEGRQELLDLSGMRDPYRLELQATSLLETGVTDWWVNSKEAWIAYQLLRALPVTDQERFAAADPGRWSKLRNALTPEMKASMAATVTTGRGPFPGRDALRKRLSDQRLWAREHAMELRALIVLAYVSDDKRWVFELSRELRADKRPGLYAALGDLGLYDEVLGPREFVGENLEIRGGGYEFLRFIDDQLPIRWILVSLGAWLFMDWVSISGYSVQVKEFDLHWAQWAMGGDLGGARLEDDPPPPRYRVVGAPPPVKSNRLSMEADLGTGALRIRLPQLKLASTNFMRGGASYRSGPVQIDNLRVTASFSDRHYREPVGAEIDADDVDIRDLVLANASLPSGAWALAHLGTQPLHVKAGATGDEDLHARAPRTGTLPIPVFGPIFQALANVVAIKGGIPFSPTVVDLLLLPIPDLPFGTGTAANALVASPAPADYLWGLATDGVLRPPRSVVERAKDAGDMLRSFELSFDKLVIEGLSIGAGTQIASLTLVDVDVGVGLSLPAYKRTLLRSLRRARTGASGAQADAIDDRIKKVEGELEGLLKDEQRLEELERKDRWEPGALELSEREELAGLSDRLRADAGIVADIGRVEVGPLSGRIAAGGARFEGIHVEAYAPLGPKGYLADETLLERLRTGAAKPQEAGELVRRSGAQISIESTQLLSAPDGGVALSIAAEKLPTIDQLRARIDKLPPTVPADLRQRLEDALAMLEAQKRVLEEKPQTADTRQRALVLEDSARRLLGITVGSATFGRITGELNPETGRLVARVHDTEVRDIYAAGVAIDRVRGDVELGVGGLDRMRGDVRTLDAATLKSTLTGSFGLDATVEGIRTEMGTIGTVTIAGLRGDVLARGEDYLLRDVWADSITIEAINLGLPGIGITGTKVTIEGLGLDADLLPAATIVTRLDVNKLSADTVVYDGGEVHAELKSGALTGIHVEQLELAGGQLVSANVRVAGVEDLRYKLVLGALTSGKHTTVEGTLQGAVGKVPVISAQYATAGGRTFGLQVKDLEALGTTVTTPDGSVVIKRVVVATTVTVTDKGTYATLDLRELNISHVDWRAGSMRITADGAITLKSLAAKGFLDNAGNLRIDDLDIKDVAADDLHLKDGPLDLHLGEAGAHPGALKIGRIHVTNFELPKGGKPTGKVEVTGFHADFGGTLAAGLETRAGIDADKITVDLMRGDTTVFRATGLAVSAYVKAGDFETNVSFAGVDTKNIVMDPTGITIEGLEIPLITLDEIHLSTKLASGKRLWLHSDRVPDGGFVHIVKLKVTAHADRAFKRIELQLFEIEKIEFDGLQLELPDDGVKITVRELGSLNTIRLEGPAGAAADPFVFTPGTGISGVARLDSATIPKLEVDIAKRFHGNVALSTETASVGFLASGGTVIDINKPRVKMKDPATMSTTDETVFVEEIGAETIHVEGGKVTIKGAGIKNVAYKQPGIEVTVEKIGTTGDIEITDITGNIPELTISEARLKVDFSKLPAGGGGSSGTVDIGDLQLLYDSLQGDLKMVVFVRVSIALPYLPDYDDQDLRIPVELHFKDGKINFQQLTRDLYRKIGAKDADEPDDPSWTVESFAEQPEFVLEGEDLVFRLRLTDITVLDVGPPIPVTKELVRWNLFGGEVRQAQKENLVRVFRLTRPAPDPDKDPDEPSALHLDTLEFQDIDANLGVRSKNPIPITFKSPGARGEIKLAPDALIGLRAKGGVPGAVRPLARASIKKPAGLEGIELDELNFQSVELHIGWTEVTTGTIEVRGLKQGSLTFKGHTPQVLDARITSATAKNISWILAP